MACAGPAGDSQGSTMRAGGSSVNRQPGPSIPQVDPWIGRRSRTAGLNAFRYTPSRLGERLARVGSEPARELGASELCSSLSWSSVANAESRVNQLSLLGSPERRGQAGGSWGSAMAGNARADPHLLPAMPAFTTRQSRSGSGMRHARQSPAGSPHLDDGSHRFAAGGRPLSSQQPGFRGGVKVRPKSRQQCASSGRHPRAGGIPPTTAGSAWRPTEHRSFFLSEVQPPSEVDWPTEERQCGGRIASRSVRPSRSTTTSVGAGTTAFQAHLANRRRASLASSIASSERTELSGW